MPLARLYLDILLYLHCSLTILILNYSLDFKNYTVEWLKLSQENKLVYIINYLTTYEEL